MNEEAELAVQLAEDKMKGAIEHLGISLRKIRAGKASPSMLDSVVVDYYGSLTPLKQVANVNTPDARSLSVQPYEKAMLDEIAKGVTHANLGFNPQSNGEMILINIPPLTEERRRDLVKKAKEEAEHAKVSIRNARKEANDGIKTAQKDGLAEDLAKGFEASVQTMTDSYGKKCEEVFARKEIDIMTV